MSAKPRIGIYVLRFPRTSETFIVTKVLNLLDQGFDVTLFCSFSDGDWDSFDVLKGRDDVRQRIVYGGKRGSRLATIRATTQLVLSKLIHHPREFLRLLQLGTKPYPGASAGYWIGVYRRLMFVGRKIDILHIEFDWQGVGIAEVKALLGCKLLLSARGEIRRTSVYSHYSQATQYLFDYADGYHFISNYLHRSLVDAGLPERIPTWLIVPAIDLTLFVPDGAAKPSAQPGAPLTIISVGRIAWAKGYEFALDAVALLVQQGVAVKYLILGNGDYEMAVQFAARQHGLLDAGVVEFGGHVPREQVVAYYQRADIMLHAALEEGFCNAVIEAQAMEIPVVTSDAGGLPENVEDGVTGFVVPRRDARALADKLLVLARDPELRQRMGKSGRERALRLYNIESQAKAFAYLYEKLPDL